MKRRVAKTACFFVLLLLMLSQAFFVCAQEKETKTVLKVAFPQTEGFSTTDANGQRHGIVVDYLNEIAKYTGWEYEYIDVDPLMVTDKFIQKEFDLMGGTYYVEGSDKYYAYPKYSAGYTKSVLLASWQRSDIRGYDYSDINGKTIGVYKSATENIRRLKEFLSINGLECEIRYFEYDEIVEHTLYYYLDSGEVDLILGNAADDTRNYHVVAYFDSQPHYIVAQPDAPEVLEQLNWALEHIFEASPNFAQERYAANFPDVGASSCNINEQEAKYISEKEKVTVALPKNYHPFCCINDDDGEHDGITHDLLAKVQETFGLEFDYIYADTYYDAIALVKNEQADMLGFFLGNEAQAVEEGLARSAEFATLSDIVVRNKSITYPSEGLTCGILRGRKLPNSVKADKVVYFDDTWLLLEAVNKGNVDFAYGLSARLESVLQQGVFANTVPVSIPESTNHISFALLRPVNPNLLTILNKTINSIPRAEKTGIVERNLISVGGRRFTLRYLIYTEPVLVISVITIILFTLLLAITAYYQGRAAAARISAQKDKAEAASRAKSDFLSRMSHEIRTPMNAIVGITDLIDIEKEPQKLQDYLKKLRTSSRYLLSLINDILDMSRIDSHMVTISDKPFSLVQMLDDIDGMMSAEAVGRGLKLEIINKIRHSGVCGDEIRLKQIILNLLSNAVKFTPEGGRVELEVCEIFCDDKNARYFFKVSDNGVGIKEEDQQRIFEAFEQAGDIVLRSKGTGLGLPLCKNLVALMGGELLLKSEPNVGSEFSFELSMKLTAQQQEVEMDDVLLRGTRMLLAEDNSINAEIARGLLEAQGAEVVWVSDGREALETFVNSPEGRFDAILMDMRMPVMDGLESTRAIRASNHAQAKTVPIVALTANSFKEDRDAVKEAGMNGFVTKPIDVKYLYSVLSGVLTKDGNL